MKAIRYRRAHEPGVLVAEVGYRDQGGARVGITRAMEGPGFVIFVPLYAFGERMADDYAEASERFLDSWEGLRGPHPSQAVAKREIAEAWAAA